MRHHHVSLKLPNKRYSISSEDRKERMTEHIKNIWLVRKYFHNTFNVDIPIINGDQVPFHRNESSNQKRLTIKGADTFVKENHMLSRERITVYTQVTHEPSVNLLPEFVFKGKGCLSKLKEPFNPLPNVKTQWSPSGSFTKSL